MNDKIIFEKPRELKQDGPTYKACFSYTIADKEEPYFIDIEVGYRDKKLSKLNDQEMIDTMLEYVKHRGMNTLNNPERQYTVTIKANDIAEYSQKKSNE